MKTPDKVLTKLVENISISAWILDEEQNVVFMNDHMREWFGDLSGKKASIIYECGSFENVDQTEAKSEGVSEVIIADVPFRRLNAIVDLEDEGKYALELFEDISEQKLIHTNMTQALEKITAETKMAKTIQNSILPIDDIYWNTIAFSSLYFPADDLGGDFYDLLKLNDDEFLIYIADVAGHGIQAALLTVFMRERVKTNVEAALSSTSELLSKMVQDFNSLDIDNTMYVTMVLCKYTRSKRELTISNAGHNCSPLIIRNNGRTETIPIRGMPVCMLAEGIDYEEETVSMNPGDRLVLFTDGIIEEIDSATGRSLGAEGVRELAKAHHSYNGAWLARTIMNKSDRFTLIGAKDDRSIIVVDILS